MSPRVLYRTVPRMKTGEPSMSEGERERGGEGVEKNTAKDVESVLKRHNPLFTSATSD